MTSSAVVGHFNVFNDIFSSFIPGFVVGKEDSLGFQTAKKNLATELSQQLPLRLMLQIMPNVFNIV
jgi:hypothetical protein